LASLAFLVIGLAVAVLMALGLWDIALRTTPASDAPAMGDYCSDSEIRTRLRRR